MFVKDLLKGKVAVITGGGTGIGLAVAKAMAAHGAHVVLAARDQARVEEAAALISKTGPKALGVAVDVADSDSVRALFKKIDAEVGPVDIMVNNAAANFMRPTAALTSVRWRKVIDIVLNGTFHCTLEAGRRMLERKSGAVINMVATYAWTGAPGFAPSASAKAGVVALTRTLGVEWAEQGVRVNALCPGLVDTVQSRERIWPEEWIREELIKSVPSGRFGTEAEMADAALFLASPMASYVNGEVFVVDGGASLGRGGLDIIKRAGVVRRARPA